MRPAAVLFNFAGDALRHQSYLWLGVATALGLALGIAVGTAGRRWLAAGGPRSDEELERVR